MLGPFTSNQFLIYWVPRDLAWKSQERGGDVEGPLGENKHVVSEVHSLYPVATVDMLLGVR